MARADSSPKALVKAAIRNQCHVVARRYEHQRLEKLHGSNVKWLILSDELFEEVCSDFTIRRLDLTRAAKRSMFDAEWVSQVTYELITKPARPRRGRQQANGESNASSPRESIVDLDASRRSNAAGNTRIVSPTQQQHYWQHEQFNDTAYNTARHDSVMCLDPCLLPPPEAKIAPSSPGATSSTRSGWFDTVLN